MISVFFVSCSVRSCPVFLNENRLQPFIFAVFNRKSKTCKRRTLSKDSYAGEENLKPVCPVSDKTNFASGESMNSDENQLSVSLSPATVEIKLFSAAALCDRA